MRILRFFLAAFLASIGGTIAFLLALAVAESESSAAELAFSPLAWFFGLYIALAPSIVAGIIMLILSEVRPAVARPWVWGVVGAVAGGALTGLMMFDNPEPTTGELLAIIVSGMAGGAAAALVFRLVCPPHPPRAIPQTDLS
ncbi:hypothetical protein [Sphingomicrobium arenosum]|uniref:hypothetical protein n=1 Tax=Sphingomicrobium arenosum TaxID=2233861 RepID=UPI00223F1EE4|nr:hypothetical protein [Sphingomicrobium arenosum]